jgi:hypothetical protein
VSTIIFANPENQIKKYQQNIANIGKVVGLCQTKQENDCRNMFVEDTGRSIAEVHMLRRAAREN